MCLHLYDGLSIHLHVSNKIKPNKGCAGSMAWYHYAGSCQK
jgi:hypothetical protein